MSWPGNSVWVDFLNPEARTWYGSLFQYENFPGTTDTIGGIWNDMNEPSIFNENIERTFPPEVVHYGQVTNRDIHNMYGLLHVNIPQILPINANCSVAVPGQSYHLWTGPKRQQRKACFRVESFPFRGVTTLRCRLDRRQHCRLAASPEQHF